MRWSTRVAMTAFAGLAGTSGALQPGLGRVPCGPIFDQPIAHQVRHAAATVVGPAASDGVDLRPRRAPENPPPRRAVDRRRSAAVEELLQSVLDTGLATHAGVGASAAVMMPGREPWTGASGTTDGTVQVTGDMLFGIASVTKTYIATVILQLAEEGLLELDDTVDLWLNPLPNVDGRATVRQLLNHTSGVFDFAEHPDYVSAMMADPTRRWSPEATITAFVLDPYADPGAVFHYSNTGYLLLGMIIEVANGSRVSTAIRDRILRPLDLDHTYFALEEEIEGVTAHPWADFDLDGVLEDISYAPRTSGESTAWAAGALYSSAEDVVRFLRALIEGGLLSTASRTSMLDVQPATQSVGYGLGVQEVYDFIDGRSGIGHDGGTYGYTARMICLPEQGVYVALLLNHSSMDPAHDYATVHDITRQLARVALSH